MARRLYRVLALAMLAGCAGKTPVTTSTADQQMGVVTNRFPVHYANLQGVAQAPSNLLANNSSGVIANGGASVVSNGGGQVISNAGATFTLADAESWAAVPAAQVVALDARRQPIPGVKAAVTDASGRFTLENVPSNMVVTVEIKASGLMLTGLAKADGTRAQINPATTVATEHLRDRFEGNEAALAHIPLEQFRQLTIAVQNVLQTEGVQVPLATPEDAGKGFDTLAETHPELREQERAVAKTASQELVQAQKNGTEATPTPRPLPTAAPSQAADPGARPSELPGPAASPGPENTPTPRPSGTRPPENNDDQGTPPPSPQPTATPRPEGTTPSAPPHGQPAVGQLLAAPHNCAGCDLTNQDVYNKHLDGADLHGAKLSGVDMHRSHLKGANFENADLTGADLHDADLTGANLRGATLTNVDMHGANLTGADLTGATLGGGDLDTHDANFNGAKWTDGTQCNNTSSGTCNH